MNEKAQKWNQSIRGKSYMAAYRRKNRERIRLQNRMSMARRRAEGREPVSQYLVMGIYTNGAEWQRVKGLYRA